MDPRFKYTYNQAPVTARQYDGAANGDITSGSAKYFEFLDPDARQSGGGSSADTPGKLPGGTAGGTSNAAGTLPLLVAGGYILNEGTAALRVRVFPDDADAKGGTAWDLSKMDFVVPPGSAGNPSSQEWACSTRALQIYADGADATYAGAGKNFWVKGLK